MHVAHSIAHKFHIISHRRAKKKIINVYARRKEIREMQKKATKKFKFFCSSSNTKKSHFFVRRKKFPPLRSRHNHNIWLKFKLIYVTSVGRRDGVGTVHLHGGIQHNKKNILSSSHFVYVYWVVTY